jgi:hypothetical protein
MFPDLVLTSPDKARRLEGIIEVETGESVNHLEAMAQWAHFGRVRAAFHLYVPAAAVEIARRLCTENQVGVAELWSYHSIGDQTRFTLVQRLNHQPSRETAPAKSERSAAKKPETKARPKAKAKPAKKKPARPAAKTKKRK